MSRNATSFSPPLYPWLPCLPSCPLSLRQQAPQLLSRRPCRQLSRRPYPQLSRRPCRRPSRRLFRHRLRLPRSLLPLSPCRLARVPPPFIHPASLCTSHPS